MLERTRVELARCSAELLGALAPPVPSPKLATSRHTRCTTAASFMFDEPPNPHVRGRAAAHAAVRRARQCSRTLADGQEITAYEAGSAGARLLAGRPRCYLCRAIRGGLRHVDDDAGALLPRLARSAPQRRARNGL